MAVPKTIVVDVTMCEQLLCDDIHICHMSTYLRVAPKLIEVDVNMCEQLLCDDIRIACTDMR